MLLSPERKQRWQDRETLQRKWHRSLVALGKVGGEEDGEGEVAVGVSSVAGRRAVSSGLRFLAPFLMTLHLVANQPCNLADLGPFMKAPETP